MQWEVAPSIYETCYWSLLEIFDDYFLDDAFKTLNE